MVPFIKLLGSLYQVLAAINMLSIYLYIYLSIYLVTYTHRETHTHTTFFKTVLVMIQTKHETEIDVYC